MLNVTRWRLVSQAARHEKGTVYEYRPPRFAKDTSRLKPGLLVVVHATAGAGQRYVLVRGSVERGRSFTEWVPPGYLKPVF